MPCILGIDKKSLDVFDKGNRGNLMHVYMLSYDLLSLFDRSFLAGCRLCHVF